MRSRLWPLPFTAIVAAIALGILLPQLDLRIDSDLPPGITSLLYSGGAETARAVLSSIAGSLITATSLTFSLTVVALQLASSQASPRVLRLFARDRQVHATLALFLGTFAYALTVLRSVRDSSDDLAEFVPRIAVTTGVVLTLVSVVMLVFFLAHLASQLRVETMLKDIHADTDDTIDLVGASNTAAPAFSGSVAIPTETRAIAATSSGFVTSRDHTALIRIAADHRVVIQEIKRVGDNVLSGTPLVRWWRPEGGESDVEALETTVRKTYALGYERTAAQDVGFGVQQVVDIGVRALSPGVNDPTTAVHALGHLGAILARAVGMPSLPEGLADDDGRLRVVSGSQPPGAVVNDGLSPFRHYAADDPTVVRRFLQVIADLHETSCEPTVDEALLFQLTALEQQLLQSVDDPAALPALLVALELVRDGVQGH